MLSIGIGLKPAPDFNIEPEHYAGQDVIGGVIKLLVVLIMQTARLHMKVWLILFFLLMVFVVP